MNDEQWKLLRPVYDERFTDATYPYPLGGYDEVMEETFVRTGKGEGARILDIWASEGNLAAHFVAQGCEVTCVADSLERARRLEARLPGASVIHAHEPGHLLDALRAGEGIEGALARVHGECAGGTFDAVVCGGGLLGAHIASYRACVEGIFARFLPGRKGVLCWADTSFEDETSRQAFEESEAGALVFEAWRDALVPRRYRVQYTQVMPCMGIYKIRRR